MNPLHPLTLAWKISVTPSVERRIMAITLSALGTYTSTNGSEISAFDPLTQRTFIVSGTRFLDILDSSNPANPQLFRSLDTSAIGIANSVAVKNGVVAVALENSNKQAPGTVAFYDVDGNFLNSVTVGALPDMLTFTPDGRRVLVANEGEPSSYNRPDSVDPEGSVSIIDLSNGVFQATVRTADFTAFNSQKDALIAQGIRIFGPNATVAQDLEPEYITVSSDSKTAWITLQENNAIAILDIPTATITDLKALGFKSHNQPTVLGLETYDFDDLPTLGTTTAGQEIPLGGFSGLHFEGYAENGNLKFVTHTDRGPNGEPTGINRPFLLPDFVPEIIRFELNRATREITITERIQLQAAPGVPLSGLPNTAINSNANTPYNDEVPVDLFGNVLCRDPLGADLEGIVVAPDGTFWMVDEYRPAIYHFDAEGVLIDRFVPIGTAAAAGEPAGTFGTEVLPAVLGQRRQNRGFEAIAFQDGKIYAFVQSPIRNPATLSNATLNGLQNIRIVEFDPVTQATRQFIYVMDNPPAVSSTDTRADKIGDAVAIGNGEFLVVERDDDAIDSDPLDQIQKKVYRFSLQGATDISNLPNLIGGKSLDQMTLAELAAAGVTPIKKTLHVDLATAGYNTVEKVEGLTLIDRNTIAVLNDNDFTVAGVTIDPTTGTFTPDPNPETPILGLITLQNNGLDASDRDSGINIRNWPVFGMYQPDAIASFVIGGQTYLITANEGDARDYTGFSEEIRVGSSNYRLDPTVFPNGAALKNNAALGRLTVTNTLGDTDRDGDFDQIYAFGARSFSIWNAQGNLIYDSGDQLEQLTAALVPAKFNSDGTPASFDTRSDNKGPEPEGVAVGVIDGRTYAFIGLERTGGVMVFDISNPTNPNFVQYADTPGDIAPEGLNFVSSDLSPTGRPLLIVTNEISKTATFYEISTASGEGYKPVITGTNRNDLLKGRSAGEIFYGLGGNDLILAGAGNNNLYGGDGNDLLQSGSGNDIANGGNGEDVIEAGNGNNLIYGGAGNDLIRTGSDDDVIYGGDGNDTIFAGGGNNTVFGGNGNDNIYVGRGINTISGGAGNDFIWLRGGQDTILLNQGGGLDTIYNFKLDQTTLALGGSLTLSDLTLTRTRDGVLIEIAATGEDLAFLKGVRVDSLLDIHFTII
ncbi:MAG: choice-of-anchor I family protein [Leptolyngbyaceae cyanobacterium HOT.MB2.61]|nr:choice-of-anchor I family protein [Leptolyngbyaceae cyanobacterium HOT.MB2.61]